MQFNVHTLGINGQVTLDTSTGLQEVLVASLLAQLTCAQDAAYVLFSDLRSIDCDGRKTVLLAEQT